ncbi:hypothetical protein N7493_005797 [Penicillium malachiteum]|uniref:Uncharacterized protein n=1 Tax=Penicillium malachiteum TaxID=1324776 RepID=A0AAD6MX60_9EURO|nr:hypothetical protein N7493_006086 [Penicillium malachiteum]KAJ5727977.1 hypothetical protein N7493_005797 [Penicillium malachiteum]
MEVIDLTDDFDVEMQDAEPTEPLLSRNGNGDMTFVSTLAHRHPAQVIPNKRKSIDSEDSEGPSDTHIAHKADKSCAVTPEDLHNFKISRPSTPSPKTGNASGFEVVIPSPSQKDKGKNRVFYPKISDLRGIQERDYPLKGPEAPWIQIVNRKIYPKQREPVDRSIVSFGVSSETQSQFPKLPSANFLRLRLRQQTEKIKGPPITFDVDEDKLSLLSSNFGFINDYVLLDGVERVDEGFNSGCNCTPGQCSPATCDCLFDEEDSDEKIKTYHSVDGQIVLRPSFLNRRSKIVECCELCSCKGKCWNTVVQSGRKVGVEIFHTGDRGFGLRSPDPIVAGQFIDRYLGEVITQKEADARELANEQGMSYLFILDWETQEHDGEDTMTQSEDFFVVDGQKFGSPTRFMNHSCNPNCKIVPVSTTHHGDDKLYDLAFFALRDIPAGTELTFDYNPNPMTTEPPQKLKLKLKPGRKPKVPKIDYGDKTRYTGNDKAHGPNIVKCLCGEKNCRGQLWLSGRKKQLKLKLRLGPDPDAKSMPPPPPPLFPKSTRKPRLNGKERAT